MTMNSDVEIRSLSFSRDGKAIVGELYLPTDAPRPLPAVILSHGYGGDAGSVAGEARYFAEHGYAAYTFDFIGGGLRSRSEGTPAEMSVLTEARDLSAVLDGIAGLDAVDEESVYLWGASQGGFVSSYVAASRPNDVRALVALFPAYVIHDDSAKRAPDPSAIPERMEVMGMTLGSVYHRDALSFDIYDLLPQYSRPVLIIHGTADTLVPISYSERAVKTFPNARLLPIPDAGHGFGGEDWITASAAALQFMEDTGASADRW